NPFGPHHCITYFGSVHAFQTNSRGASKTLVTTMRSVSFTVLFFISDLRLFHTFKNYIQLFKTLFPELPIADRPVADSLDRLWPEGEDTLSSTLGLGHKPRPHQVGDMFRNHLLRQCKLFGQAVHRGMPAGEPLDHRSPGRIRQSRKCCTQPIHNHMVVYFRWMSSGHFPTPVFCSLSSEA